MNFIFMLGIFIFAILAIAFFSASETAFLSISKIKMRALVQAKKKNADIAMKLRRDTDLFLTLILIGTNFFTAAAATLAASFAFSFFGAAGVGAASVVSTAFTAIFGNIIPKTASVLFPEKIALSFAPVLFVLRNIFFPVVWIFSRVAHGISFFAACIFKTDADEINEDDIKMLFHVGMSEGTLEKKESAMLSKIFEFDEVIVHDIMKHRSRVSFVSIHSSAREARNLFLQTGYSRLPVFKNTIDEIAGVLDWKAVLFSSNEACAESDFIKRTMKKILFVPETFSALEVLQAFKKAKTDFACVLDEQACTAGIITLSDVVRVVFGRMTDEHPGNGAAPEERIRIVSADEFIVPGDMELSDVNAILKLQLESENFHTLGGFLLEKFGALPESGELYVDGKTAFIIEDQAMRRIISVRIKKGIEKLPQKQPAKN